MIKLSIETNHVLQDLKGLQTFDINAYGRAAALIQALHENQNTALGQDLIDQLNMQNRDISFGRQMIGNSLLIQNEKLERNIWRLKLRCINSDNKTYLEPYRIIYGFFPAGQVRRTPEIRIFAVPCRTHKREDSYDYEPDHPITIRFRADYDAYI